MHDILTVTLNPALDLATSVTHVQPNVKLRCSPPDLDPGGGGLNVARAIHLLGGRSRCFVALGGDTGQALLKLLHEFGLEPVIHEAPGETRQSLAVTDLSSHDQFRFMLPGPEWTRGDLAAAREAIKAAAPKDGYLVLSGSGPSGAAPDLYAKICQDFAGTDVKIVLDTSGPTLAHLAAGQEVPPRVLRMDSHEAEELARRPLPNRKDSALFAHTLVGRGAAEVVVVARDADGSVLATEGRLLHVAAAKVDVVSKVGAGDSFVGAFTLALANGEGLDVALAHGACAASAAVMSPGTQLCSRADFDRLLSECAVTEL
ncbi:1-phosphofructokinase family hexose kinase [Wenxinia marina]|uniref:Phosphofructokinase n=1 Tax=Wenxinia marina DSM 24838 TaxID=1123501 RepID=A0A0D0QHC3_9RHOB|nr:1-phosphofructokinase family hexose kinase [Wenxinia marina]KIQ70468.1 6-phosphofructokinase [Wenxinia marina DSM 24838]GGL52883.1 phosphofructokinase [Wenxinia marina]